MLYIGVSACDTSAGEGGACDSTVNGRRAGKVESRYCPLTGFLKTIISGLF